MARVDLGGQSTLGRIPFFLSSLSFLRPVVSIHKERRCTSKDDVVTSAILYSLSPRLRYWFGYCLRGFLEMPNDLLCVDPLWPTLLGHQGVKVIYARPGLSLSLCASLVSFISRIHRWSTSSTFIPVGSIFNLPSVLMLWSTGLRLDQQNSPSLSLSLSFPLVKTGRWRDRVPGRNRSVDPANHLSWSLGPVGGISSFFTFLLHDFTCTL